VITLHVLEFMSLFHGIASPTAKRKAIITSKSAIIQSYNFE